MAERYRFPFGNTVGVQENLISINEEATKNAILTSEGEMTFTHKKLLPGMRQSVL